MSIIHMMLSLNKTDIYMFCCPLSSFDVNKLIVHGIIKFVT